jgi:integrase/recombinase XerD
MSNLYTRNEIYWARFKVRGVEYRHRLRTRTKSVAEKRLKKLRESIENEAQFGIAGPVTWPAAVVSWNEHIGRSISPTTFTRYVSSLGQVRTWLDPRAVQEITGTVLRELVKGRQRQGVSNASIRRDLTAVSSVLAHCVDEGWVEENVAQAFNRKRVPERRDPILLPSETEVALTIGTRQTRFGDMILLARETGMRQEEIAGLEHGAVDVKAQTITFIGKRRKLRAIPLSKTAVEIIDRQPRFLKCPFVFWHMDEDAEGKPIAARYRNVSSNFGDYTERAAARAEKAGVPYRRFRFHDLRHLFAVDFLRSGKGGIYDLQRILGHTTITTTEVYLDYLTPEEAQAARTGVAQKAAQKRRSGTDD